MNYNTVRQIYSGRPGPGWELTDEQAKEAWRIWNNLKEASLIWKLEESRVFEKFLVSTAPQGKLPQGFSADF